MKTFAFVVGRIALLSILVMTTTPAAQAANPPAATGNFHHPLNITNPYLVLEPGTTFVYEGTNDRGKPTHQEFAIASQIRTILDVDTRLVRDTTWETGRLVEETYDWFAQDDAGNVWCFGEFSIQFKNDKSVGHVSSWEAGVDGAQQGIVMEAHPKVDDTYQQELATGIAEDEVAVLSLTESVCLPRGCFSHALKTKEFSPLEPGVAEHKYYAPGVGHVQTIKVEGGSEESHLVMIVSND